MFLSNQTPQQGDRAEISEMHISKPEPNPAGPTGSQGPTEGVKTRRHAYASRPRPFTPPR